MIGGTINHSEIAAKFNRVLGNHLDDSGCRTLNSDARINILPTTDYSYPDGSVTCDDRDKITTQYIAYPCLIVEVLSDSTVRAASACTYGRLTPTQKLMTVVKSFIGTVVIQFCKSMFSSVLNQSRSILEFGRFFTLNVGEIRQELQILIDRFEAWKARLVSNPNILGGEIVFPDSRLSVQRIGGSLERGESVEVLREDYPYLTDEDLDFARIYVKAYPIQGRPKVDEVYN